MVNPSLCLFLHPITLLIFCNLISNIIRFLLLLVLQLLYFVIFSVLLTVHFVQFPRIFVFTAIKECVARERNNVQTYKWPQTAAYVI